MTTKVLSNVSGRVKEIDIAPYFNYAANLGDGVSLSYVITHNLGTRDVTVLVYRSSSPYDVIETYVELTSTNTVTLTFLTAPTSNEYRVVISSGSYLAPRGDGDVQEIESITTSNSQTTVSFQNIPNTFKHLEILYSIRDTSAAGSDYILSMKINNDATSGNYDTTQIDYGSGGSALATTVSSTANGMGIGNVAGTNLSANAITGGTIKIFNYVNAHSKLVHAINHRFYSSSTRLVSNWGSIYFPTTPISSLIFTTSGTAFADGFTFTLLGIGGNGVSRFQNDPSLIDALASYQAQALLGAL
jgi:hypothetical protein